MIIQPTSPTERHDPPHPAFTCPPRALTSLTLSHNTHIVGASLTNYTPLTDLQNTILREKWTRISQEDIPVTDVTHHTSQHLLILLALSSDNTLIALLKYEPHESVSIHNLDDHIQIHPVESTDTHTTLMSPTQTRVACEVLHQDLLGSHRRTHSPFSVQLLSTVFATTTQLHILQGLRLNTRPGDAPPTQLHPLFAQVGARPFLQSVERATQFARVAPMRATIQSSSTQSFSLMEDPPRETTEVVRLTLFLENCDKPYHIHQPDQTVFVARKENTGVIYIVSPETPPPQPDNHSLQLSIEFVPIGNEHPERNIIHTYSGRVAVVASAMDRVFLC